MSLFTVVDKFYFRKKLLLFVKIYKINNYSFVYKVIFVFFKIRCVIFIFFIILNIF
jgi:hypothetical protein